MGYSIPPCRPAKTGRLRTTKGLLHLRTVWEPPPGKKRGEREVRENSEFTEQVPKRYQKLEGLSHGQSSPSKGTKSCPPSRFRCEEVPLMHTQVSTRDGEIRAFYRVTATSC